MYPMCSLIGVYSFRKKDPDAKDLDIGMHRVPPNHSRKDLASCIDLQIPNHRLNICVQLDSTIYSSETRLRSHRTHNKNTIITCPYTPYHPQHTVSKLNSKHLSINDVSPPNEHMMITYPNFQEKIDGQRRLFRPSLTN